MMMSSALRSSLSSAGRAWSIAVENFREWYENGVYGHRWARRGAIIGALQRPETERRMRETYPGR